MFGIARLNTLAKIIVAGRTAKTITNGGGATVSTTQSKFGGASLAVSIAALNNTHYVSIAGSATNTDLNWGTGDFTVEMWVYPTTNGNSGGSANTTIVDSRSASADAAGIAMQFDSNNYLRLYMGSGGGGGNLIQGATAITINTWNHIAAVRSSGTVYLYLNGVAQGGGGVANSSSVTNATAPTFGRSSYNTAFVYRGYIDEIRISNSVRYPSGTTFTPSTSAFTNDANTLFLMHANGTNGQTTFTDDNA